jgi:putative serine protease PepD
MSEPEHEQRPAVPARPSPAPTSTTQSLGAHPGQQDTGAAAGAAATTGAFPTAQYPSYPQTAPYPQAAPPFGPSPSQYPAASPYPGASPYQQPGQYGQPSPASGGPAGPDPVRRTGAGRPGRGLFIAVAAVVLALSSGLVGGLVAHRIDRTAASAPVTYTAAPTVNRSSLADVAAAAQPTVVDINTGQGEGSGVIYSAEGVIITNNHVIANATANTVNVTFNNGKTSQARIVATDPAGDIAVIKAEGVSGLTPAKFGNSDSMRVGDTVLAIGSPLGLQGSVTEGIISSLHRTITEGDQAGGSAHSIADALQTDAAINPGNSGGALVNLSGEVIGINTAIATSGQNAGNIGVGFAIPSNKAKAAADQLIAGGKVSHPYLGVRLTDSAGGALIAEVVPGGPAEKAGIQRGDVVTKAGTRAIANSNALVAAVQAGKAGEQLQLTIQRNGSEQQVTVTLGEAP